METMEKTITAALAVLALTLAFSSVALAQSSLDGYTGPGPKAQDQVQGVLEGGGNGPGGNGPSGNVAAADDSGAGGGGNLPFTGLDLALLAGAGGLLLAFGIGIHRITRGPESA